MEPMPGLPIPELETVYLLLIKGFLLIGGFLYVIFALLVTRQIKLMKQTLETPLSATMTMLGLFHFGFAVAAFVFFLLTL